MKKFYFFIIVIFVMLFILSSCFKREFEVIPELAFSSEFSKILKADNNNIKISFTLKLDSPIADLGEARLYVKKGDEKNLIIHDMTPINKTTFSSTISISQEGTYTFQGLFTLNNSFFESNSLKTSIFSKNNVKVNLNLTDDKNNLIEDNTFEPYNSYNLLITTNISNEILRNFGLTYKIRDNNNKIIQEGFLNSNSLNATNLFLKNESYTFTLDVFENEDQICENFFIISPKEIKYVQLEDDPPILKKVSIESTAVYSTESTSDFCDLETSNSISNPRILIEFTDDSNLDISKPLNIKIYDFNNPEKTISLNAINFINNHYVKVSGVLEGITMSSNETYRISIDSNQIFDEYGNTDYYEINFKTK